MHTLAPLMAKHRATLREITSQLNGHWKLPSSLKVLTSMMMMINDYTIATCRAGSHHAGSRAGDR